MSNMTERFVILSSVSAIEDHKQQVYVSGAGESAVFSETSLGWFLYLAGSHEAIHVGMEKPDLLVGDKMKITIEKV